MKTINSLVVRVKGTHEDKLTIKNEHGDQVELHVPMGYSQGDLEKKETTNNKYTRVKMYGEVVGEAVLVKRGAALKYEYPKGFPEPILYRNSERIASQMEFYNPSQRETYKYHRSLTYDASGYEGAELADISQQEIDVRKGDKAYFSYLGYDDDSFIKKEDGWDYYKIPFDMLYCVVRDGEIKMLNGNVFVRPYYGEDFEQIEFEGKSFWGKFLGDTGIIETIKKKPEYLQGVVSHIGSPLGRDTRHSVKKGDRVLFTPANAVGEDDIKDKVEGEEYFTMSQWDIMAKVLDNYQIDLGAFKDGVDVIKCVEEVASTNKVKDEWFVDRKEGERKSYEKLTTSLMPVGDYALIKSTDTILNGKRKLYDPKAKEQKVEKGQILLLEDTVKKAPPTEGVIMGCGELCETVTQDLNVRFHGGTYIEEYDSWVVRECNIWGVVEN